MNARVGVGLVALACGWLACGCSAPTACNEKRWLQEPNLERQTSGSESLGETSAPVRRALEMKLTHLPELWQGSGNIFGGYVTVNITTEYASAPKGNDGMTQMPRVKAQLSLDGADQNVTASTSSFPSGSAPSDQLLLFQNCGEGDTGPGCCPYGSRECTVPLSLSVARLDGAPYPPVNVTWSVQSTANATSCPLEKEVQIQLALSEVAP